MGVAALQLQKFKASDLAKNMTEEQLWALNDTNRIELEFDDGSVHVVSGRSTILSWHYWEFHRLYPTLPLLPKHHLLDRPFKAGMDLKLLGAGLWDVFDHFNGDVSLDRLCKQGYEIVNMVYNKLTVALEEYVTTVSIEDFIDLVMDPEIAGIRKEMEPTEGSIKRGYNKITRVIENKQFPKLNPIVDAVRSKTIKIGQVHQMFCRGFITDVDSTIFVKPLMKGYVDGFTKLVESMVESRSGAKALLATGIPLQETEYFNRKMQLLTQVVQELRPGDCGSTHYVSVHVTEENFRSLDGKYHKTDLGLEIITPESTDLIGSLIKMRSALTCNHRHDGAVCETCVGELALSIPSGPRYNVYTNLGHVAATLICAMISQSVLSTKHLDGSSSAEELIISREGQRYIRHGADKSHIHLSDDMVGKEVSLIVHSDYASNLGDIETVEDVSDLSITRLTKLKRATFMVNTREGVTTGEVGTTMGEREASLSYEFLKYMKSHGFDLTSEGHYKIDLSEWDADQPIFIMPLKHLNMLEYMNTIKSFLEGNDDKGRTRGRSRRKARRKKANPNQVSYHISPSQALAKFHEIVSTRIQVNIAYLEIILLSSMVRERDVDSRIPPAGQEEVEFEVLRRAINNRSMSAVMAYEHHHNNLINPLSYVITNRMDHPMDGIQGG